MYLREKKGYSFEQLEDLEIETELLLYGLTKPEDYPKELENRMKISSKDANEIINELNNSIFQKVRNELIKISENKKKQIISETEKIEQNKFILNKNISLPTTQETKK